MKKLLLVASMAILAWAGASATTDGKTYEEVNGLKIVNCWSFDRVHTPKEFQASPICHTRARTAVMKDDVIYVPRSEEKAVVVAPGDTVVAAVVHRFSALDGKALPDLDITLDGRPFGTFLGVNSIGVDNFGHLWVAPYTSEKATSIPLYMLNGESGELTLIADLEKGDVIARTDYYDLVGDITREQAPCKVVNAGTNVPTLYSWFADVDGDFEGGFEGDTYLDATMFYPETVTEWGYGPFAKILLGEDEETLYNGDLMYVDGFYSMPLLYSGDGSLIDSFENVETELWPEDGTNGVTEFHIDGRNFIVYSMAQYSGDGHGCQANICELGPDMALEGMTKYWQIPADSLGKVSDGGNRIHCFNVQYSKDDKGEEVVTLFNFKSFNGMSVYKIGKNVEPGPGPEPGVKGDINGDGVVDIADVNACIDMILGLQAATAVGDVNGDGNVDVADMNAIIDIVL
ncbi:MAG: dockerin type I repeat-containing protein, partial [Bacteroidales bacterium]|nr:dockerin type I repeat-containing protein [Candidatus Sodaliphilus fimicaballi]